ncbi:EAL domain-containing protein [Izhakiella capsodis]|uniref:EAL domain-containing protein n=1 Tax=Izhakiella capsodis TaxID=1367852 RepID=A0A1I4UXS7_9GAMM|nr:EAL domain-containing protein [Izhakiella capsodis]SFM93718.1 EAL domain-containing protein [Izhakiella capsodis]
MRFSISSIATAKYMTNEFICVPIHTPCGGIIGVDLSLISSARELKDDRLAARDNYSQISFTEKERLLLRQLQAVEQQADFFLSENLVCGVNIDFHLAGIITSSPVIKETLRKLTFVRLKISEKFPNLDDGLDNPLIHSLIEQKNRLWLDDLGAGFCNLSALQSCLFEAVKFDRRFYLKHVGKPFFSVIINKVHQFSERIIIEGVENTQQLETLHANHIWGVQGYYGPSVRLDCLRRDLR